jgi:hypothetical protein
VRIEAKPSKYMSGVPSSQMAKGRQSPCIFLQSLVRLFLDPNKVRQIHMLYLSQHRLASYFIQYITLDKKPASVRAESLMECQRQRQALVSVSSSFRGMILMPCPHCYHLISCLYRRQTLSSPSKRLSRSICSSASRHSKLGKRDCMKSPHTGIDLHTSM